MRPARSQLRRLLTTPILAATLVAPISAAAGPGAEPTAAAPAGTPPATVAGSRSPLVGAPGIVGGPRLLAQAGPAAVAWPAGAAGPPVLAQAGPAASAGPRVLARAAILADESTGQVLFERNPNVPRAMASTTKVMTALLALERLDERRVVVIGSGPPKVGEESLRLRRGERLTVRQLLLGLLVKSANDAGVALAEAVDGSEAAFVRRMNRRAAALRLGTTHYVTPYGLDRPGHQTSSRDLARLWEVAMRRADFRSLVATRSARLPGVPLSLRRFVTTNQLLGSYRWVVGGKTGFTNRAGRCLVASASRGGRRLVAVTLGSPNAFADVRALFEYGFSKFVRARLAARGQPVSPAPGRPASLQVAADVDALVRLDDLRRVRLSIAPGTTGTGSGAGSGAWFAVGQRRLVRVPLAPLPAVPSPSTTFAPPGGSAPSASGSAAPQGSGATPATPTSGTAPGAATLAAGAVVRAWAVPPGAVDPTIDSFLRRDPP